MHSCLSMLHALLTRGHPAVAWDCAKNAAFLKSIRQGWLRAAQQPGQVENLFIIIAFKYF